MNKPINPNIDIAVIGLSCRVPGADTPDEFWGNLINGIESIAFFSDEELIAAGVDPQLVANQNYVKAAPRLKDVESFDAGFFGYSPKEARMLDPQHRLFLEVAWETLEGAGYNPFDIPGKVGVISTGGGVVSSYLLSNHGKTGFAGQTASIEHNANDKDFIGTRVAFHFNLTGPSYTVQSACSSSTVAVHEACNKLRTGECDAMIAGGSVVRVPQVEGYLAEKLNLHSLDGHCRPFDAEGQGTIFGSAVGAVLLKPLEHALEDDDNIYAVIKSSATNNDGSGINLDAPNKRGFTAPSIDQQASAAIDCLEKANIDPESINYIECHSTGTLVGDPIEIEALSKALSSSSRKKQYCAVGSVKGNIGHPEQAAGIVGLIKVCLSLKHGQIPPSINYSKPNENIDFKKSPFFVNDKLSKFPGRQTLKRAGLNSLGIGGTNAFVILEQSPAKKQNSLPDNQISHIVTLSAKSADALVERVKQMSFWLSNNQNVSLRDFSINCNLTKSQFGFRFCVVVESINQLQQEIQKFLAKVNKNPDLIVKSPDRSGENNRMAFLFTGQGAQYSKMTKILYETNEVFRANMDLCDKVSKPYIKKGLLNIIFAKGVSKSLINRTDYTQPALFAVEYSLFSLFDSWGISPSAVIGHSLGEVAAACVGGVMTVPEAMEFVTIRGNLMQSLTSGGAMASIYADDDIVSDFIKQNKLDLVIAACNGALSTTVSGNEKIVDQMLLDLEKSGIKAKKLEISNGFHSPETEPILKRIEKAASKIKHKTPKINLVSNLTGEIVEGSLNKNYWSKQLRNCVQFKKGISTIYEMGCDTFVEIGPQPKLLIHGEQCLKYTKEKLKWIQTLDSETNDDIAINNAIKNLYLAGINPDWKKVNGHKNYQKLSLPTYPFQRKRFWIDGDSNKKSTRIADNFSTHPLLGTLTDSSTNRICYENQISLETCDYLSDHRVDNVAIIPAAMIMECIYSAGRSHLRTSRVCLQNVLHFDSLVLPENTSIPIKIELSVRNNRVFGFSFSSLANSGESKIFTQGILSAIPELPPGIADHIQHIKSRCQRIIDVTTYYDELRQSGLNYGERFSGLREIRAGQQESLSIARLSPRLNRDGFSIHPALLDSCLQTYPMVLDGPHYEIHEGKKTTFIPESTTSYRCFQDQIDECLIYTKLQISTDSNKKVVDVRVYDNECKPVAEILGLTLKKIPIEIVNKTRAQVPNQVFHKLDWVALNGQHTTQPNEHPTIGSWVIFSDSKSKFGDRLGSKLESLGHQCTYIYSGKSSRKRTSTKYSVNPSDDQETIKLLESLKEDIYLQNQHYLGILYLWGLDVPGIDKLGLTGIHGASEKTTRAALNIIHHLSSASIRKNVSPKFWIFTNEAQLADDVININPIQASLWGLGRTIALEKPGRWGGLIDISLESNTEFSIDLSIQTISKNSQENQLVFRNTDVYVPRLNTIKQLDKGFQATILTDATYLITGGFGRIGRTVMDWLVDKGAKNLILTGRNANHSDNLIHIEKFRQESIRIECVSMDIGNERDVVKLFKFIKDEMPELKGIVHSAGILEDQILENLSWNLFEKVYQSKIYGSWLLHKYTENLDLDFFVLKSSLLSILGSETQANYTAASAFMDALVEYRQSNDQTGLSCNWCAWSGEGLATKSGEEGVKKWRKLGMQFITPDFAYKLYDQMMDSKSSQIAVAVADWKKYKSATKQDRGMLENLGSNDTLKNTPEIDQNINPTYSKNQVSTDLSKIESSNGTNILSSSTNIHNKELFDGALFRNKLLEIIQEQMELEDEFDKDEALDMLGMNSMIAVSTSGQMEEQFGVTVQVAELISNGPSFNQLVEQMSELYEENRIISGSDEANYSKEPENFEPQPNEIADQRKQENLILGSDEISNQALNNSSSIFTPHVATSQGENSSVRFSLDSIENSHEKPDAVNNTHNPDIGQHSDHTRTDEKPWLRSPNPGNDKELQLICFPFAGGGFNGFRDWVNFIDSRIQIWVVEAPGRGSRLSERPAETLDEYVNRLIPQLEEKLTKPTGFFGHCLGGLTMFETYRALNTGPKEKVVHLFAGGIRPPHLLKKRGAFEEDLMYDQLMYPNYDILKKPYEQDDEIFADLISHFDVPEAILMMKDPDLRKAYLPTVRAEFRMATMYQFNLPEKLEIPISSFVGDVDPWVSVDYSCAWGDLTTGKFKNHTRPGSHFLMEQDKEYIINQISTDLTNLK